MTHEDKNKELLLMIFYIYDELLWFFMNVFEIKTNIVKKKMKQDFFLFLHKLLEI